MVKVLHVLPGGKYFGGTERYLYNYYKYMDRNHVHFDFLFGIANSMSIVEKDEVMKDSDFIELGAIKGEDNTFAEWYKYFVELKKYVKNYSYDYIEIQTASILVLTISIMAVKNSKTNIIAHAHSIINKPKNIKQKIIFCLCRNYLNWNCNYIFSCSDLAATELFGKNTLKKHNYFKIPNAINMEAFLYDPKERREIRDKYGISEDTIVVGHVARLSLEKNQEFLVKVFGKIYESNSKVLLWIIGDGDMREHLIKAVNELNLSNNVVFWGERSDISSYLQAMDIFVVPSFNEGLCISAIESQIAGLPTFVSDGVPDECNITGSFYKIALEKSEDEWASIILDKYHSLNGRTEKERMVTSDYDIKKSSADLERFYLEHV